jgi:probable F420-dependent oxidoreductase
MKVDAGGYAPTVDGAANAATQAETDGYDGWFAVETQIDPFLGCALAAERTSRLEIGTGIAVAFARNPMTVALQANDVQALSEGRFILGLGSQIKPHITRRYGMPWSQPAARMTEYVAALRAIWHTWQTGDALDFRGDFYEHTLMPPLFSPGALDVPSPRVWLAAVGPLMVAAAGAVADGLISHPLLSRSYLAEAVVPAVRRSRSEQTSENAFEISALCMVATARTEEALEDAVAGVRRQIGFYASTPAYRPVLDHHGWGDLHAEAHALTKADRWAELGDLVDDEVLHTFAVVGEMDEAAIGLRQRFAGLADRVTTSMPYDADDLLALDLLTSGPV